MRDDFALYLRYIALSLRAQLQYRASFVLLCVGQALTTGIEYLGIVALFARFGNLRGYSLPTVALFYGVANVAFALAEGIGRGFDTFPALVQSGDFDRVLLRPRGAALQIVGQELQLMRIGRLVQGTAVLVWAAAHLGLVWTLPKLVLLVATILGGACLFGGLFVLQATLAFWTVETLEIMNAVTYGGTETAQYPLTIYRPWFRRFFTFVIPLACVNYLPARALLAPPGTAPLLSWLAPLGGVLFLAISLRLWQIGVRHYHSTGS